MSLRKTLAALACAALLPLATLSAQDIETEFSTDDGFVTGSFAPTTLPSTTTPGFDVTFSLGQQQQFFDGGSYVNGPDGFLFINGTFNGVSGDGIDDDSGLIDFTGIGASEVTFFGANRANGPAVAFEVFGVDDTTSLGTFSITQTALSATATETVLTEADLGAAIGSIEFNLPGPASPVNPPYVLAIDTFTATASTSAVPEPSSATILVIGMCAMASRRRRNR